MQSGSVPSAFPAVSYFNVMIIRNFNTVNTLNMVELRYSQTWHVSIIFWSPSWLVSIPWWGEDRWVSPYQPKPRWSWVIRQKNQPHQSAVKTEQLCQAWWRQKVSFMYTHNLCTHSTHIWRNAKLRVTKPTNTEFKTLVWDNNFHNKANTTHLRWNFITATAANNFQLTTHVLTSK